MFLHLQMVVKPAEVEEVEGEEREQQEVERPQPQRRLSQNHQDIIGEIKAAAKANGTR